MIADMNGDGKLDIIKQTSLNAPLYVGVAYNDPANEGFFDTYEVVNNLAPYFISIGDLNNDGKNDIVVTDDGADRYMLNQGNAPDGTADFLSLLFSFDAASDDGFGSNNLIADLNNDSWNDVLIADVDVDIGGCGRRMHIYRNLGGTPGSTVTLQEQTSGVGCDTGSGNPATCEVASIPADKLVGVHDVAVFDIDGDGWKDMVIGRCSSTEVWMNVPPSGLVFSYPQGLPFFIAPGAPSSFQVQVTELGGVNHQNNTGKLYYSADGAAFVEQSMNHLGGGLYEGTFPATACTSNLEFYVTADATGGNGGTYSDPSDAPTSSFGGISAAGTEIFFEEDFEGTVSGWTVVNDVALTAGAWEVAEPNGTVTGGGVQAAPDDDAEGTTKVKAFVTENGLPGGGSGASDVDGGPTDLISPPISLINTDGLVTYSRWFYTSDNDEMVVSVSNDGSNWVDVETVTGVQNSWQVASFRVGDYVTPNATVQVRFRVSDSPNNSVTEGGVDLFRVERFVCASCTTALDCADADFCNGSEQCVAGSCVPGSDPCPGQVCDEGSDICLDCFVDGDCDDADFCTGTETCVSNVCLGGDDPCVGQLCDEGGDICVDCLDNNDCADSLFCNGVEQCLGGSCSAGPEACPGRLCDEGTDICIGSVTLQPRMGQPLDGLTGPQLLRFENGKVDFGTNLTEADGLGPVFNQDSCTSCHSVPEGGSGSIMVTRFGFNDEKGAGFDPLANLGGSLLQSESISAMCAETVPLSANVTTNRLTPSTLGFGLIEAIADFDIEANALTPPPGVSGAAHMVNPLEAPTTTRVGRFGWKSQVATILTFSADASLNEMGLTNRLVPTENAPNGDNGLLALCDTVVDPEDRTDAQGFDFIDRVTDFQRFLAPPPQTPRFGMSGEVVFNSIGCASCHTPSFTTSLGAQYEAIVRNKPVHPYSDFLLHDMGLAADFIEQGAAGASELRTTPLWGLRVRDPLWHDGRFAGGTFDSRATGAIGGHDSLNSEGQASAQAFAALSQTDKDALIAFLDSLGRAEFDHDGDNDVDVDDMTEFNLCFSGPGSFYGPDDPCSISDVDQDGDVDDDDFDLFLAAAEGDAGGVPNLMLGIDLTGMITMNWGASCSSDDSDYEIYEGTIGDFTNLFQTLCSTGGSTSATLAAAAGDVFYLIVPTNGFREGSYGQDSDGNERPSALSTCLPQSAGACVP